MLALLQAQPRLVVIVALVFSVAMGMGLMVPVLPQFAERFGHGAAAGGLLLSAFGAARLIVNLPAGLASDRFGRRPIMIAGLVVLTGASFLSAFATSFAMLALGLFTQGIGSALYVTAALAAVADLAPRESRGVAMSLYQGGLLLGISMGPAFGGLLGAAFGPSGPFMAQGLFALAGSIGAVFFLEETRGADPAASTTPAPVAPRFVWSDLGGPLAAGLVVMIGTMIARVVANWQLLPFIARADFGFGPERIGALLTIGAIANIIVLPSVGRLVDRFGSRRVVVIGAFCVAGALAVPSAGLGEPGLWITVALLAAATGLVAPACSAYAIEASSLGYGATMGVLRMAGDLGIVSGPILVAQILALTPIGERGALIVVAGMMVVLGLMFRLVARRRGGG